jgi:hypothetical protein
MAIFPFFYSWHHWSRILLIICNMENNFQMETVDKVEVCILCYVLNPLLKHYLHDDIYQNAESEIISLHISLNVHHTEKSFKYHLQIQ